MKTDQWAEIWHEEVDFNKNRFAGAVFLKAWLELVEERVERCRKGQGRNGAVKKWGDSLKE